MDVRSGRSRQGPAVWRLTFGFWAGLLQLVDGLLRLGCDVGLVDEPARHHPEADGVLAVEVHFGRLESGVGAGCAREPGEGLFWVAGFAEECRFGVALPEAIGGKDVAGVARRG